MKGRMFEDLVVSAPPAGRFGTRAAVLPLSVAAHAVALAAALLLPALTPPELPPPPVPDLVVDWVSAPPKPPPVIATPAPARLTKAPPSHDSARAAVADPVAPPPAPGPTVSMIDPTAVLPEDGRAPCLFNCAGSTPDGNSDGPRGGTPGPGADEGTGGGPIRPGGDIKPPVRTVYVAPPYPDLARAARIQGLVVIECTIDPSGRVVDARVITGHPLLQNAALDAVRQWRYKATRLNGVPVAVLMTVTVNFSLGR